MCGIFGLVSTGGKDVSGQEVKSLVSDLYSLSESRGKEASGLSLYRGQVISVLKQPMPASKFIRTKEYKSVIDQFLIELREPKSYALIGHSRLVTDGSSMTHENNQPVVTEHSVAIHNGIIVNAKEIFQKHKNLQRDYEVDTEAFLDYFNYRVDVTGNLIESLRETYRVIEGVASIALLSKKFKGLILGTNNGSLYYAFDSSKQLFIFASEYIIVKKALDKYKDLFGDGEVRQLCPQTAMAIDMYNLSTVNIDLDKSEDVQLTLTIGEVQIVDILSSQKLNLTKQKFCDVQTPNCVRDKEKGLLKYDESLLLKTKRCSCCLLPENFPFIHFDKLGECNYCKNYQKVDHYGVASLKEELGLSTYKSKRHLLALSGGRDSCYALHYLTKELGEKVITFTYDWGMVTDLARRNISRMCAKLNVENILVSADIGIKRENIRKNIVAWLKRPNLGTVPLFMAGDKQFFYYAQKVREQNSAGKMIFGMNPLERTDFKTGFCGIQNSNEAKRANHYRLDWFNNVKLSLFYSKEFLLNPSYINSSLVDTMFAYFSYYFFPHDHVLLFKYLPWKEDLIVNTLIDQYGWEVANDTQTTWRIGDGTASFYNYIYLSLAGFTESDTFRSNQIREGLISREKAFAMVLEENRPRYEAIKWYCNVVGLDFSETISKINSVVSGKEKNINH